MWQLARALFVVTILLVACEVHDQISEEDCIGLWSPSHEPVYWPDAVGRDPSIELSEDKTFKVNDFPMEDFDENDHLKWVEGRGTWSLLREGDDVTLDLKVAHTSPEIGGIPRTRWIALYRHGRDPRLKIVFGDPDGHKWLMFKLNPELKWTVER